MQWLLNPPWATERERRISFPDHLVCHLPGDERNPLERPGPANEGRTLHRTSVLKAISPHLPVSVQCVCCLQWRTSLSTAYTWLCSDPSFMVELGREEIVNIWRLLSGTGTRVKSPHFVSPVLMLPGRSEGNISSSESNTYVLPRGSLLWCKHLFTGLKKKRLIFCLVEEISPPQWQQNMAQNWRLSSWHPDLCHHLTESFSSLVYPESEDRSLTTSSGQGTALHPTQQLS